MKKVIILALLLLNISTSKAEFSSIDSIYTGKVLLQYCKETLNALKLPPEITHEQVMESSLCLGFVSGAVDGWRLTVLERKGTLPFDVPQDVTDPEIIRVLIKYLENHPERLQSPGIVSLWFSLIEAFPPKN
jgi:hypothetical protein